MSALAAHPECSGVGESSSSVSSVSAAAPGGQCPRSPSFAADAWQQEYLASLPEQQRLLSSAPPPWPLRVLRSAQLDALRLDDELIAMLREQFGRVFALFQPGRVAGLEPELNALLSFMIFRLSVGTGRATPGSELMNLRYRDERAMAAAERAASHAAAGPSGRGGGSGSGKTGAAPPSWLRGGRTGVEGPSLSPGQRWLFGAGYVLIPYLWQRAHRLAAHQEWGAGWGGGSDARARAWRLLRWVEGAYKVGVVANMWVFLLDGRYRTLLERALGARLVYRQPSMSRLVSFEYLNRQLVWQELSEFLLFLLPLVNVPRLKRAMLRAFPRLPLLTAGGGGGGAAGGAAALEWTVEAAGGKARGGGGGKDGGVGGGAGAGVERRRRRVSFVDEAGAGAAAGAAARGVGASGTPGDAASEGAEFDPPGPCPVCGLREIVVPYVALPCRHVFCYYCLRGHCEADTAFECPVDGVRVAALRRYGWRRERGGRAGDER